MPRAASGTLPPKKIFVEVALLRTIEARNAISIDTLLKQLQAIRSGDSPPPSASRPAQQRPVAAAAAPNPAEAESIPVSAETCCADGERSNGSCCRSSAFVATVAGRSRAGQHVYAQLPRATRIPCRSRRMS
jgi:hypothetical protein